MARSMSDQIYDKGKVLMRDEDERPLAVACKTCGRFALNTETGLCAQCSNGADLRDGMTVLSNAFAVFMNHREPSK